jgi:lipopolysaccharide cholinephosphotransferase
MHDDGDLADCGIFIDIFPIENTYDNPFARKLHGYASMAAGLLYSCRRFARDRAFYERFGRGDKGFLRTIRAKALIGVPLCAWSMETWTRIILDIYSRCKDADSTFVVVPSGRKHFFGELYRRDDLVRTRFASFEGRKVRIPVHAEQYLNNMYGDWQRIPAPEEREHHAYLELDFGPYALEE